MTVSLISIDDAIASGVFKLRLPHWALPTDHIELAPVSGGVGPWVKLWSETNERIGEKNPHQFLITELNRAKPEWLPYDAAAAMGVGSNKNSAAGPLSETGGAND